MPGKPGFIRLLLGVILSSSALSSGAQEVKTWIEAAEERSIREEEPQISEAELEVRQELRLYPVNLNEATREQLESCGLFSAFQVNSILRYREKYGDLLSIYELASLDGFRKQSLARQSACMTVGQFSHSIPLRKSGTRILVFAGRNFNSSGDEISYPGSPWKSSLRIKSDISRKVSAGLAYEKDPGERSFWGYRPEHLTAFLELKGKKHLEKLIIGTYRLNNGMGLLQGSGLMHTPEAIQSRPLRLSSLKPYAGTSEGLIHQGAALGLNLGKTKLLLWTSWQNLDLSLTAFDSKAKDISWTVYIRETGIHRTVTELSGRNLAYLGCAGIQVMSNFRKLSLGAQHLSWISGLSQAGKDSLQYFQNPGFQHASSIYWGWRLSKVVLYGEFAPGRNNSTAFTGGSRFLVNDFLSGTLQFHSYGTNHQESFASAYASGSHIANERGFFLLILAEPFREIRATFSVELSRYPEPRYQVLVPSSGSRFKVTLHNGSAGTLQWKLGMTHTNRQFTPSSDLSGIRPLYTIENHKIDGKLLYQPFERLSWQSRLVISYTPGDLSDRGHAALQQVTFRMNEKLRCTVQFVMFHVPSWDNRICIYEPGLFQQFRFPVYSATGNKLTMVASTKFLKRLTLEMKCSVLRKNKVDNWETGVQLRMNF